MAGRSKVPPSSKAAFSGWRSARRTWSHGRSALQRPRPDPTALSRSSSSLASEASAAGTARTTLQQRRTSRSVTRRDRSTASSRSSSAPNDILLTEHPPTVPFRLSPVVCRLLYHCCGSLNPSSADASSILSRAQLRVNALRFCVMSDLQRKALGHLELSLPLQAVRPPRDEDQGGDEDHDSIGALGQQPMTVSVPPRRAG